MFKAKRQPDSHDQPTDGEIQPDASADADADQTQTQEIEMSDAAADLVKQLQSELDEAVEARKRALADFRNYQRRALESEQRALQSGATRVVKAMLPALDQLDLALSQNMQSMTLEQLAAAVKILRDEFSKAIVSQGVERIEPQRGEAFDPHRHEAVMRQPAPDLQANSVVSTLQAGYAMGDVVLRPAKVAVAPGNDE